MKLDKVRLGMSAITKEIYAYIPEKNNPENMLHKKNVTEDFRAIAIKQVQEKQEEIDRIEADNKWLRETLANSWRTLLVCEDNVSGAALLAVKSMIKEIEASQRLGG